MYPADLKYTKDHEWVRIDGNEAVVGITDYAQKQLGDVVFVELPEVGRKVGQGEVFGTIESVKAVSEVYAPASGEILAVNTDLADRPETINQDPYGKGWILKFRLADPAEIASLMDATAYKAYVAEKSA